MKSCSNCKETKVFTKFNKSSSHKDGHQSQCRLCQKQINKQYRNSNKNKIAKYRNENKESIAINKKLQNAAATPCVYRIKSKVSGIYYIGSTTQPLCNRVSLHFAKATGLESPFTGKDKSSWEIQQLCTGTKEQVRELERYMLSTRVGIDKNCINKRIG